MAPEKESSPRYNLRNKPPPVPSASLPPAHDPTSPESAARTPARKPASPVSSPARRVLRSATKARPPSQPTPRRARAAPAAPPHPPEPNPPRVLRSAHAKPPPPAPSEPAHARAARPSTTERLRAADSLLRPAHAPRPDAQPPPPPSEPRVTRRRPVSAHAAASHVASLRASRDARVTTRRNPAPAPQHQPPPPDQRVATRPNATAAAQPAPVPADRRLAARQKLTQNAQPASLPPPGERRLATRRRLRAVDSGTEDKPAAPSRPEQPSRNEKSESQPQTPAKSNTEPPARRTLRSASKPARPAPAALLSQDSTASAHAARNGSAHATRRLFENEREAAEGSASESVSRATDFVRTLDNINQWRKDDLVVECRRRRLPVSGTKRELRHRILQHASKEKEDKEPAAPARGEESSHHLTGRTHTSTESQHGPRVSSATAPSNAKRQEISTHRAQQSIIHAADGEQVSPGNISSQANSDAGAAGNSVVMQNSDQQAVHVDHDEGLEQRQEKPPHEDDEAEFKDKRIVQREPIDKAPDERCETTHTSPRPASPSPNTERPGADVDGAIHAEPENALKGTVDCNARPNSVLADLGNGGAAAPMPRSAVRSNNLPGQSGPSTTHGSAVILSEKYSHEAELPVANDIPVIDETKMSKSHAETAAIARESIVDSGEAASLDRSVRDGDSVMEVAKVERSTTAVEIVRGPDENAELKDTSVPAIALCSLNAGGGSLSENLPSGKKTAQTKSASAEEAAGREHGIAPDEPHLEKDDDTTSPVDRKDVIVSTSACASNIARGDSRVGDPDRPVKEPAKNLLRNGENVPLIALETEESTPNVTSNEGQVIVSSEGEPPPMPLIGGKLEVDRDVVDERPTSSIHDAKLGTSAQQQHTDADNVVNRTDHPTAEEPPAPLVQFLPHRVSKNVSSQHGISPLEASKEDGTVAQGGPRVPTDTKSCDREQAESADLKQTDRGNVTPGRLESSEIGGQDGNDPVKSINAHPTVTDGGNDNVLVPEELMDRERPQQAEEDQEGDDDNMDLEDDLRHAFPEDKNLVDRVNSGKSDFTRLVDTGALFVGHRQEERETLVDLHKNEVKMKVSSSTDDLPHVGTEIGELPEEAVPEKADDDDKHYGQAGANGRDCQQVGLSLEPNSSERPGHVVPTEPREKKPISTRVTRPVTAGSAAASVRTRDGDITVRPNMTGLGAPDISMCGLDGAQLGTGGMLSEERGSGKQCANTFGETRPGSGEGSDFVPSLGSSENRRNAADQNPNQPVHEVWEESHEMVSGSAVPPAEEHDVRGLKLEGNVTTCKLPPSAGQQSGAEYEEVDDAGSFSESPLPSPRPFLPSGSFDTQDRNHHRPVDEKNVRSAETVSNRQFANAVGERASEILSSSVHHHVHDGAEDEENRYSNGEGESAEEDMDESTRQDPPAMGNGVQQELGSEPGVHQMGTSSTPPTPQADNGSSEIEDSDANSADPGMLQGAHSDEEQRSGDEAEIFDIDASEEQVMSGSHPGGAPLNEDQVNHLSGSQDPDHDMRSSEESRSSSDSNGSDEDRGRDRLSPDRSFSSSEPGASNPHSEITAPVPNQPQDATGAAAQSQSDVISVSADESNSESGEKVQSVGDSDRERNGPGKTEALAGLSGHQGDEEGSGVDQNELTGAEQGQRSPQFQTHIPPTHRLPQLPLEKSKSISVYKAVSMHEVAGSENRLTSSREAIRIQQAAAPTPCVTTGTRDVQTSASLRNTTTSPTNDVLTRAPPPLSSIKPGHARNEAGAVLMGTHIALSNLKNSTSLRTREPPGDILGRIPELKTPGDPPHVKTSSETSAPQGNLTAPPPSPCPSAPVGDVFVRARRFESKFAGSSNSRGYRAERVDSRQSRPPERQNDRDRNINSEAGKRRKLGPEEPVRDTSNNSAVNNFPLPSFAHLRQKSNYKQGQLLQHSKMRTEDADSRPSKRVRRTLPLMPLTEMPTPARTLGAYTPVTPLGQRQTEYEPNVSRLLTFDNSREEPSGTLLDRLARIEQKEAPRRFKAFRNASIGAPLPNARSSVNLDNSGLLFHMGSTPARRKIRSLPFDKYSSRVNVVQLSNGWNPEELSKASAQKARTVAESAESVRKRKRPSPSPFEGLKNTPRTIHAAASGRPSKRVSFEIAPDISRSKKRAR